MSDPNPATVEAMRPVFGDASALVELYSMGVACVADRLVAAAREEERERYAPLVDAARAMVESSFLLDAEEQALAAALSDLGGDTP